MSVDTISDDAAAVFSRLQLARALKEDPENIYSAEESAIFQRQRNTFALQQPTNEFHLPRPLSLLIPPILNDDEEDKSSQPNTPIQTKHSSQQVSQQVRRQSQAFTSSPRTSVIIPEERRGSGSKTLLDVRQSMLENRHIIHNANPFSTSSSHRTSMILQQNKTLPDAIGKLKPGNVTNSRPNSLLVSSPRPTSTYTINAANSRPTSFYKQNKSFIPQDSEENDEESEPSVNSPKPKSQKSSKIKKSSSSSSDGSDSPPTLPPIKSISNDTPLALKSTPKIKVAPPPRITTMRKNSNGRIEAWLEHVSGSPEGSPNQSPTRSHSPRVRTSHNMNQHNSRPLVASKRTSLVVEPVHQAQSRRRPISAFVPGDKHLPQPDIHQPRKRANSEFVPRKRTDSMLIEPPIPHGRVSPNPRQDSGYWAKDTLLALSEDFRHVNLMNDMSAPSTKSKNSNISNGSSNKSTNRHRRNGSGNINKPSSPKLQIPVGGHGSHTNNNMNKRLSSELLIPSNRNSILYQQKNRIRS
ncbi:16567_t:CDS:2 [Funneliformis mosseae]|uniref:16567_t:CDS:1 n=1 Tax=Funneliformis mosseae TaxID=27381 RepID=A0A9N8W2B0_FUNMO|nr:16567_t:CDS:2 [Funneliformis mosseae]